MNKFTDINIANQKIDQLKEQNAQLLAALEVARTSLKAHLQREGYEWVGEDCEQIDAAIIAAKGE